MFQFSVAMKPCLNTFRRGCHFGVLLNPRAGLHLTIALPERMRKDSEAATDHLFKRFSGNKNCNIQSSIWLLDGRNPAPVEMLDSRNIMGPCSSNVAQDFCIQHTWQHNGTMFIQYGTGFLYTTYMAGWGQGVGGTTCSWLARAFAGIPTAALNEEDNKKLSCGMRKSDLAEHSARNSESSVV